MEEKNINRNDEKQRQQMIESIIKAVQVMDDRKLRNVYKLVLHIQ